MKRDVCMRLAIGVATLNVVMIAPASAQNAQGWTSPGTIQTFSARQWGADLNIPGTTNPMGCSGVGWVRLETSMENYQAVYAMALTAASAHWQIQFWVTACDTDGTPLVAAAISPVG